MKTVIVTGASSGIGKEIASELCDDYRIINISRTESMFENITGDFANRLFVRDLIDKVAEKLGEDEIYYLINNAGFMPLEEENIKIYDAVMDVNLRVPYLLSLNLAPQITGGIINIASVSGVQSIMDDENIGYGISKGGLILMTKYFAKKFPKLSINSISPGFIEPTNLAPGDTPQFLIDMVPMKREGNVKEIGKLVRYLIDEGKYITGQNIVIDGGLTL